MLFIIISTGLKIITKFYKNIVIILIARYNLTAIYYVFQC